ncbi:hypothetical protein TKK_0017550 [Trichogramma kaykai]|uniref:Queuine tRNA-ribosyltransferase accessory subunit 2 n=1 Tax=Trichogramma kaykai TaxID=54128 RepID=A0ABD2W2C1_9HYME
MRFSTESVTRCSARIGKLSEIESLPNLSFETPLLMIYTKRGCVPHLTKNVFKKLTKEQELLVTSLPSSIRIADFCKPSQSFSDFVGMQEYPFFMNIHDPAELSESGHQVKDSISVWSRNGRSSVSPQRYMQIIEQLKPEMYVTLCDGDTDKDSSEKRIMKGFERTKKQFEQCIKIHTQSKVLQNKGVLGAIEGGYNLKAREKCIQFMENKPLLGYAIDGLHKNGPTVQNISTSQIEPVVKHCVNLLPVEKLKAMMGCWNPSVILDLVNLGIDLFDSSYPYIMTENNKALTFLCDDCQEGNVKESINIEEKCYVEDFSPICKSCDCLTCKNHTKAYIHHLIQTKELLSQVLLMIHNTHHYMEFFKNIRRHIKEGTFQEFKTKIQSRCLNSIKNNA